MKTRAPRPPRHFKPHAVVHGPDPRSFLLSLMVLTTTFKWHTAAVCWVEVYPLELPAHMHLHLLPLAHKHTKTVQ